MNKLLFSTLSFILIFCLVRADDLSKQKIQEKIIKIENNLITALNACINNKFDHNTCEDRVFKINQRTYNKEDMRLALEAFNNLYEINCSQESEKLTYECKLIEAMGNNMLFKYKSLKTEQK